LIVVGIVHVHTFFGLAIFPYATAGVEKTRTFQFAIIDEVTWPYFQCQGSLYWHKKGYSNFFMERCRLIEAVTDARIRLPLKVSDPLPTTPLRRQQSSHRGPDLPKLETQYVPAGHTANNFSSGLMSPILHLPGPSAYNEMTQS
jgi:hypothetical protein